MLVKPPFRCKTCRKPHPTLQAMWKCLDSHPLPKHAERLARIQSIPKARALYKKRRREGLSENDAIKSVEGSGLWGVGKTKSKPRTLRGRLEKWPGWRRYYSELKAKGYRPGPALEAVKRELTRREYQQTTRKAEELPPEPDDIREPPRAIEDD